MINLRTWLLFALLALLGGAAWLYYFANTTLLLPESPFRFTLKPGSTIKAVARQLTERELLSHSWSFAMLARILEKSGQIKAGDYELKENPTPLQLLALFGKGQQVDQVAIQFIEGQTFVDMRAVLNGHSALKHDSQELTEAEILRKFGSNQTKAEGLFFPDTYLVIPGTSDLKLLERSYVAMEKNLASEWDKRAPDLPYMAPYQALIMASIIEKETGQAAERPLIASVFINRLKKHMLLQTDPTVIYGIGPSFNGNLRKGDLQRDTPYNTYTRAGLPPTPIAMPGLAAVRAALNPEESSVLYFVAKGDGTHEFSANLTAHNRAVSRYQR